MMMIIVVCTSFKYNLHFNQMRRGGTGNMPLWSSEQRKGGPGPKSWKQRERARPGHRPTDTPTSPIVVASSDDEAPKPKQVGTKHRVEVNDDGYAEEYAEYVGFEYKGMYIHLREIDELQNTGEPTVFRRTQEMEGGYRIHHGRSDPAYATEANQQHCHQIDRRQRDFHREPG